MTDPLIYSLPCQASERDSRKAKLTPKIPNEVLLSRNIRGMLKKVTLVETVDKARKHNSFIRKS